MIFKNKKHADRFFSALSNLDYESVNRDLVASIYILTCYKRVWKHFRSFIADGIGLCPESFEEFDPHSATEAALVQAAFDLLYCSDCVSLAELTDTDSIPDGAFLAIVHAIGYVRYGFDEGSEGMEVVEGINC